MPPVVASPSTSVPPAQIVLLPVIAAGVATTVTVLAAEQPVDSVYRIFVTPTVMPVAIPVAEPIVAIPVILLLHTPPPEAASVIELPKHMLLLPVMGAGAGSTVTDIVASTPLTSYVITATPAIKPVATPPDVMVSTEGSLLDHVPPGVTSASVIVPPTHKAVGPVIGAVAKEAMDSSNARRVR